MNKPNFETMSKDELKTYVLAHRDDTEAFHALCDHLYSDLAPGNIDVKTTTTCQVNQAINIK